MYNWKQTRTSTTASDNVFVIDNFDMPLLHSKRRIWVYLPPDYFLNTAKRYPTVYLQDGQNLFDKHTSYTGEWAIDNTMNDLFKAGDGGAIVIGIENASANRIYEYSPWVNPRMKQGGGGALYASFMVKTLKPFIDKHFRTLPERIHTAIGGSSMGALISMYTLWEYPEVFSKGFIFSPAFWFNTQLYAFIQNKEHKYDDTRLCFIAGRREGGRMEMMMNKVAHVLYAKGFSPERVSIKVHADGEHNEWYWRREFGQAYKWLFANNKHIDTHTYIHLEVLSQKEHNALFRIKNFKDTARVDVFNVKGKKRRTIKTTKAEFKINMNRWAKGSYFIVAYNEMYEVLGALRWFKNG